MSKRNRERRWQKCKCGYQFDPAILAAAKQEMDKMAARGHKIASVQIARCGDCPTLYKHDGKTLTPLTPAEEFKLRMLRPQLFETMDRTPTTSYPILQIGKR